MDGLLDLLAFWLSCDFLWSNSRRVASATVASSTGIKMMERYRAVLLSLQTELKYGLTFMVVKSHWQLQLWIVSVVVEALTA